MCRIWYQIKKKKYIFVSIIDDTENRAFEIYRSFMNTINNESSKTVPIRTL
jgi:hypothetical protein